MGVLSGVVAVSKRSGGSGMRLCGATGLAQPRLIGRLLRSSGPSPACPPAKCLPVAGQQACESGRIATTIVDSSRQKCAKKRWYAYLGGGAVDNDQTTFLQGVVVLFAKGVQQP